MGKKVKFGIMCEGTTFPRWQANAIIQLLKLNNVTCELLIFKNWNIFKYQAVNVFEKVK